ncbi:carbohydrate ABC transporter membrane protein 2 (CUT1 family) [Aliiruegeria haliotis]|uniref:Carbohydrate ABC transporter membrane protein 2 (CUT1 family) n=1 Tax=Aliiruegeria haliotis TaxID=1280846 RepID=A0A2T0RLY3_9RHOB|nr:carbohydrate ABC transporter permease [Aliiruegeria haliotis]PRY22123.1 carbohydrate ABC transporter membrane protein 2 (CUT1 family) [Aliiruegeria haliotis]
MQRTLSPSGLRMAALLMFIAIYTAYSAGPFVWVAMMSLRTTTEISAAPYALPETLHFWKFASAWTESNYDTYFFNSVTIVFSAVAILTIVGGMAAHCFARYRFRFKGLIYLLIFSTIIFPPQVTVIGLFQIMVEYGLYNSRVGLVMVYVAIQMPVTIYILESFFARIPKDLFDAARIDGYSEWAIFWRISLPVALPAISTTIILNTILLWNEFLYAVVLITEDDKRTLPLGVLRFLGDQLEDVGMIATGLMIAIVPVVLIYVFFSERLIQGMTAGAVK